MKTHLLTNALLWLTKTDRETYYQSSHNMKWTIKNLGLLALFVGILAFVSAIAFIISFFIELDPPLTHEIPFYGWFIAILGGLFWSILVIALEHEIVASRSKRASIMPLMLAISLGYILVVPLQVALFQNIINNELMQEKLAQKTSDNSIPLPLNEWLANTDSDYLRLNNNSSQNQDFVSQYKILKEILSRPENNGSYWLAALITLLFVLISSMPPIVKLISKP